MLENYEALSDGEKEMFKNIINTLLIHTYVFKYSDTLRQSDDFYFARRNIELINEYLGIAGYEVTIDDNWGICYVSSFPPSARSRFDKLTTTFLYTLRHMYETRREDTTSSFVIVKVGELISEFLDISGGEKKPSNKEISTALRTIRNANLISKAKGDWDRDDTEIMILPSILLVLSQEKILKLEDEYIGDEEEIDLEEEDE